MSARDRILGKLRAAPVADTLPAMPDVKGWYATHTRTEDRQARVQRLRAALEAVHTEVYDTTDDDWHTVLLDILARKGLKKLLIGTGTTHGAQLEALQPPDLELVRYARPISEWQDILFDETDASLTLARSAIAETGSMVLWPSPSEPRLMSLVPAVHFVMLDVTTIHSDLHAAMRDEGWAGQLPTNALLISSPSKTADIQQTLAYGAHGPRELVVLLRHPTGESA